ncbi:hypothetical protein M885DRAFT_526101 [Pelagophyceae sp. CCMP2097]|nr:hypothetical protein M885DRAFT_526101 [Pelagophyceae sp. CCMP2097]
MTAELLSRERLRLQELSVRRDELAADCKREAAEKRRTAEDLAAAVRRTSEAAALEAGAAALRVDQARRVRELDLRIDLLRQWRLLRDAVAAGDVDALLSTASFWTAPLRAAVAAALGGCRAAVALRLRRALVELGWPRGVLDDDDGAAARDAHAPAGPQQRAALDRAKHAARQLAAIDEKTQEAAPHRAAAGALEMMEPIEARFVAFFVTAEDAAALPRRDADEERLGTRRRDKPEWHARWLARVWAANRGAYADIVGDSAALADGLGRLAQLKLLDSLDFVTRRPTELSRYVDAYVDLGGRVPFRLAASPLATLAETPERAALWRSVDAAAVAAQMDRALARSDDRGPDGDSLAALFRDPDSVPSAPRPAGADGPAAGPPGGGAARPSASGGAPGRTAAAALRSSHAAYDVCVVLQGLRQRYAGAGDASLRRAATASAVDRLRKWFAGHAAAVGDDAVARAGWERRRGGAATDATWRRACAACRVAACAADKLRDDDDGDVAATRGAAAAPGRATAAARPMMIGGGAVFKAAIGFSAKKLGAPREAAGGEVAGPAALEVDCAAFARKLAASAKTSMRSVERAHARQPAVAERWLAAFVAEVLDALPLGVALEGVVRPLAAYAFDDVVLNEATVRGAAQRARALAAALGSSVAPKLDDAAKLLELEQAQRRSLLDAFCALAPGDDLEAAVATADAAVEAQLAAMLAACNVDALSPAEAARLLLKSE